MRRGEIGDVPACAAILNAWIDGTAWMPRVHPAEDAARFLGNRLFVEHEIWVIDAPVAGFIAIDPKKRMIHSLYVAATGRGLGKRLLDRAKRDYERLELWAFLANERARRFYAREGFDELRRTDGENEENLPDVLLGWARA